jgi:probable rRNA maturation factor
MSKVNIFKVTVVDRQKSVQIPIGTRLLVRRICISILKYENIDFDADVCVTFVDNDYIQSLNKQYRGIDAPTDMLSFSYSEDGEYEVNPETGAKFLGDIVISVEKAVEESKLERTTMQEKIMFWVAHSLLHLLGYNHNDDSGMAIMDDICSKMVHIVGDPYTKFRIDMPL